MKFVVSLCAYRLEGNRMTVEAETPEEACAKALAEDDGEYESYELGESWVETVSPTNACEELPIPVKYREPDNIAATLLREIAGLSASGDGATDDDSGFVHDTGDSLDTLDAVIHAARKALGMAHDERADILLPEPSAE